MFQPKPIFNKTYKHAQASKTWFSWIFILKKIIAYSGWTCYIHNRWYHLIHSMNFVQKKHAEIPPFLGGKPGCCHDVWRMLSPSLAKTLVPSQDDLQILTNPWHLPSLDEGMKYPCTTAPWAPWASWNMKMGNLPFGQNKMFLLGYRWVLFFLGVCIKYSSS